MKKLVVFGGSGFLGREIIKIAREDYHVISVSRHGQPALDEEWLSTIEWIKGDVFQPESWRYVLKDADIVIDAIGLLVENRKKGLTYERFNIEPAKLTANEAQKMKVPYFVYISANRFTTFFLKRYFHSKARAESIVLSYFPHALLVRPSFMYGKHRKLTTTHAKMIHLAKKIPFVSQPIKQLQPQKVEEVAQAITLKMKEMTEEK
ncbi:MAG TPA: NAD(P)H-binding protein [Enterococcus sp.]|nr:NAD(P)H-binding protein [Enterococcus sp.]